MAALVEGGRLQGRDAERAPTAATSPAGEPTSGARSRRSGGAVERADWPIRVRIARPDDQDAVLAFATSTWDGWDYIPEVWDAWVVPSSGVVLVATVETPLHGGRAARRRRTPLAVGQPVAMTRLVMLSETRPGWRASAWTPGARHGRGHGPPGGRAALDRGARRSGGPLHDRLDERRVAATRGPTRPGGDRPLANLRRLSRHGDDPTVVARRSIEATLSRLRRLRMEAWPRMLGRRNLHAGAWPLRVPALGLPEATEERFRHLDRDEVVTSPRGDAWAVLIVNRPRSSLGPVARHLCRWRRRGAPSTCSCGSAAPRSACRIRTRPSSAASPSGSLRRATPLGGGGHRCSGPSTRRAPSPEPTIRASWPMATSLATSQPRRP